jgi:ABC-type glycerol-3-phosphate transport system substrate-binding protein
MGRRGFIAALLLLSLAAAGFATGKQEAVVGTTAQPYAGTTIRYMAVAEPISDFIRNEIIPAFTQETGIQVEMDTTDYVRLHDKQVLELVAGRYDVYQIDQFWASNYVKNGWLASLDPLIEQLDIPVENYYESLMQIGSLEGRQYVLPLSAIPVIYYYNMPMFQAEGLQPGDTWEDVLNIARRLTKDTNADGVPDQWGFTVRGERGNPITWTFLPILWSFGGQILDENMRPVYNSPEAIAAVEMFKQLNQYSPPGWHSAQEVAGLMQQGQAAQLTLMSVYAGSMDDPAQSKVVDQIGFAEMPRGSTGERASILGLWTIGIAERSSRKEASAVFLDYLARPDVAKKMAFSGTVSPTMPRIYQEPDAPRFYPVIGEVLNYVHVPPLIPESEEWFLSIGTALQEALSGAKTAKQAMDDSVQAVTVLLREAGYFQ